MLNRSKLFAIAAVASIMVGAVFAAATMIPANSFINFVIVVVDILGLIGLGLLGLGAVTLRRRSSASAFLVSVR